MLTRLSVSGFKNLVGVDVRFGPFTCIAGTNGVGKSNLFDAITFLSYLATYPLQEAALMVRDEQNKTGDLRSLFTRTGDEHVAQMSFAAEMIVPMQGTDDLGQTADASISFLRYELVLGYEESSTISTVGRLVLLSERLVHINRGDAARKLGFAHRPDWRNSVIKGRRTAPFISIGAERDHTVIQRHQEGNQGRTWKYSASTLTRTVLSASTAAEASTALLAKQEMQSWRLLQLEPTALRRPDSFMATTRLGSDGSHLPATLYRLARQDGAEHENEHYAQIGNRLNELNEDVKRVRIDRDDKRELLTLEIEDRSGTRHSARALSDGTLRFLALTVIEEDPQLGGVLCLEEPENGIHPARIPAMLELLQDIATDPTIPIGPDNPLRQVIINTHSPAVVQLIPQDCLVIADRISNREGGKTVSRVRFSAVPDTWRVVDNPTASVVQLGKLLDYLNPVPYKIARRAKGERLIDRADIQQLSLFPAASLTPEPHAA
ncbi:AAA family ATPase [Hymenobacter guriensis]|uniref:AAA family ATPase n=1 Tax=Hymenobacter guriensis TaxID=2793065 RepID=A0ABS0L8G7_9BACT|nr:AAA family ATPase [Hymenobacter guriensis]MBG8556200.1 AAA family ATPase [Hymenobacter guriensis]